MICGLALPGAAQQISVLFAEPVRPPVQVEQTQRSLSEQPLPPMEFLAPEPGMSAELEAAIAKERHGDAKYDVAKIGMRGIGGGMNFYSLDREQQMGRELAGEVESGSRLIADPVVTEYVNRLGQNLVRNSDAKVPFTIKVIDDDQVNAFALPGGYFYVNSGLILAADNEAELAGVMAHEIAHVAARHATKNATKAELFNLASIPLIFVGGPAGYAVRQAAALLVPMSFLKFSRNAEREADLLGMEYMYAAGYDPQAFLEFFEKLEVKGKEKHSMLAKAFSTHPMTEDRVRDAQKTIERYLPDRDAYVVTTSEFDQVRARLAALQARHEIETNNTRPMLHTRGHEGNGPVLRTPPKPDATSTTESKDPDQPTLKRPN